MSNIGGPSTRNLLQNADLNNILNASRSGIVGTADDHGVKARSMFFSGLATIATKLSPDLQAQNKEAKLNLLMALKTEFELDESTLFNLEVKIDVHGNRPLKMSTAQDIISSLLIAKEQDRAEFGDLAGFGGKLPKDGYISLIEQDEFVTYTTTKFNEFASKGEIRLPGNQPEQQKQIDVPLLLKGEAIFEIDDPIEKVIYDTENALKDEQKTGKPEITNFDEIIFGKSTSGTDELDDVLGEILHDSGVKTGGEDLEKVINEAEKMVRNDDFEMKQDKTDEPDVEDLIYGSSSNSNDELGDLLKDIASGKGSEGDGDIFEQGKSYAPTTNSIDNLLSKPLWEIGTEGHEQHTPGEKETRVKPEKDLSMPGKSTFDEKNLLVDVKDYAPTNDRLNKLANTPLHEVIDRMNAEKK